MTSPSGSASTRAAVTRSPESGVGAIDFAPPDSSDTSTAGETTLVVAPKEQPPRKLSGKRTAADQDGSPAIDRLEPLGAHSGKQVATPHRRSNRSIGSPGNLSG